MIITASIIGLGIFLLAQAILVAMLVAEVRRLRSLLFSCCGNLSALGELQRSQNKLIHTMIKGVSGIYTVVTGTEPVELEKLEEEENGEV